jgi:hypothetical protein
MSSLDRDVRIAIYRSFVDDCVAPTAGVVASEIGAPIGEVSDAFRRLAGDHVITLLPGDAYIWMANPFSAVPTDFTVRAQGKRWWGNCIWDALGILAGLHADGTVSTRCPDCGDALEVRVEDGEASSDADAVHFSIPAARWWDSIGDT